VRLDFLARLKEARPSLPALPEISLYLARVAVAESYQGRGVSKALMEDFFGRLGKETSWCLHVSTDNARALRFFRRFGFERFGEEEAGYLAMVRPTD
jgi:ribosomal protein S18 acetylase RimI-like enzyme